MDAHIFYPACVLLSAYKLLIIVLSSHEENVMSRVIILFDIKIIVYSARLGQGWRMRSSSHNNRQRVIFMIPQILTKSMKNLKPLLWSLLNLNHLQETLKSNAVMNCSSGWRKEARKVGNCCYIWVKFIVRMFKWRHL